MQMAITSRAVVAGMVLSLAVALPAEKFLRQVFRLYTTSENDHHTESQIAPSYRVCVQTVQRSATMMAVRFIIGAIPNVISNLLICAKRCTLCLRTAVPIACVLFGLVAAAWSADWSGPEQQLAHKVFVVTGPGAVALVIENRSSLGRRDSEIIQNGLRGALQGLGIRFVKEEQAASKVDVSLSENPASYVWVAKIRQGANDAAVVMISAPRPESSTVPSPESVPLSLRKTSLWTQNDPILDIAVLEEGATPSRIAVLSSESLSLYRFQSGKWQPEQRLGIGHAQPWPRDLRGRLVQSMIDVYLRRIINDAATLRTINRRALMICRCCQRD
jgi:hypothetical protein